jgi:hypothetical protein
MTGEGGRKRESLPRNNKRELGLGKKKKKGK